MARAVHLVFLLHGLFGSPSNLTSLVDALERAHAARHGDDGDGNAAHGDVELRILLAKSYVGGRTWDGVDVNAWRAAEELLVELDRIEDEGKHVVAFSITGYSLGGLIARALLPIVAARRPGLLERAAASYTSIATPHAGIMRYATRLGGVVYGVGRRVFGRTGTQLYLTDAPHGGCLLERMADPDGPYVAALRLFPHIRIFANGVHDLTVPYPTASISHTDPFETHAEDGIEVDVDGDAVLCGWRGKDGAGERLLDAAAVDERLRTAGRRDDAVQPKESQLSSSPADGLKEAGTAAVQAALDGAVPPQRIRPPVPPFLILNLPGPFKYLLFTCLPVLFPLWIMFASTMLFITSVQSFHRVRRHRTIVRDLMSAMPPSDEATEKTPLLSAPAVASATSSTESTALSSLPGSGAAMPGSGAATPALSPRGTHLPTQAQHRIITRLSTLPLERTIAWFPWAYNAHGTIIVRHRMFRGGEGVVRRWGEGLVVAAEDRRAVAAAGWAGLGTRAGDEDTADDQEVDALLASAG